MKRLILMTLFTSVSQAQEFSGPTDKDLLEVTFNFIEESQKAMKPAAEKNCDQERAKEKETLNLKKADEEIICLCNIPEEKQNLLSPIIGDITSKVITLNSGNDNFFHGVFQGNETLRPYDGDDKGRTVNFGGGLKISGNDGSLELKVDSTGFGRLKTINGDSKGADGKRYLNFHEMNTLDFRLEKILEKEKSSNLYAIGEFNLTHRTDEGIYSRQAQEWWHRFSRDSLNMNIVQYRYLKDEDATTSARIMGGLGKNWITDLGNWKCATKAEIRIGLTATKGGVSPELAVRTEGKLIHSSVKWIALSAWAEAKSGYVGKSYEGGITLSAPIKRKNYTIEPFIGIERHKTSLDKKYGSPSGNAFENYHVFGVKIKY